MKGQQLIDFIKQNNLEDAQIFVGCQGYSNLDDPKDEYLITCNIFNNKNSKAVLIADHCYYEQIEL
jgi:hypothetical protein